MSDPGGPGEGDPTPEDDAFAGEFALRLLDPRETAASALRYAREPEFARLVEAWRARLAPLDAAFAAIPPSPSLWPRIEARLFGKRQSALGRIWSSAGVWRTLSAATAAAAVYLALMGPVILGPPPDTAPPDTPPARLISALASADSEVELLALLEPQAAVLTINRTSGGAAEGRALELWLIEGDAAPVSLGVLPDAARARVPLEAEVADRIGAGATLAVSDEPLGGSPTGAPTGDVLAAGEITEI